MKKTNKQKKNCKLFMFMPAKGEGVNYIRCDLQAVLQKMH